MMNALVATIQITRTVLDGVKLIVVNIMKVTRAIDFIKVCVGLIFFKTANR